MTSRERQTPVSEFHINHSTIWYKFWGAPPDFFYPIGDLRVTSERRKDATVLGIHCLKSGDPKALMGSSRHLDISHPKGLIVILKAHGITEDKHLRIRPFQFFDLVI